MDIKITGVGFQGKREHLYVLGKAAENVELYSISKAVSKNSKDNTNAKVYEASAKAYLDIMARDYVFWNYVAAGLKPNDLKMAKNCLKPIEEFGVKPLEYFKKFLKEVMESNPEKSKYDVTKREKLFEQLA